MRADPAGDDLRRVERALADSRAGRRSCPVAPPTSSSGRCPASCSRRAVSTCTRWPTCRLGGGRVEADVERDRPAVERFAQLVEVGRVLDQAAPLQVVYESHLAILPHPPDRDVPGFSAAAW